MDTSLSPQEAKDRVQTEINEILQCLENKMDEMFTEIETLEEECLSKQRQKQKKIDKINALIEQTEELADNSLLGVQNRIITDLQNELSVASIQESKCSVEFEWGFSSGVISLINSITLRRLDGDTDKDRTPPYLPTSPLASPDGSDATRSKLSETSDAGRSYLTEEQYDTVKQTERGGLGGRHNLNHEHKGRRGFTRDGSSDSGPNRGGFGGRTDSNRGGFGGRTNSNQERFGGRTDSNRGGFGERTDSNREGFGGRTNSNQERFGGRTDSNRGGFGERTDSNREGFGGRTNSNQERFGGRTDSNRGGFGERTDSNQERFGGRTDSNRGGFGERTDSNREGFGGRTDSNREGFGGRTDSNRGGFGGRTDSNREGFGGRTDSNREGFGGRTDSNRERRAPRDRHTANRERPNREPRLQTGLNTEGNDLNQRRADKQRTYVNRQAYRSVPAAQTEFPDNDIEDSINFVSESTRGQDRNSPIRNIHCKDRSDAHLRNIHDSSARSRGHPRDFHRSDSRTGRDSVSWDDD